MIIAFDSNRASTRRSVFARYGKASFFVVARNDDRDFRISRFEISDFAMSSVESPISDLLSFELGESSFKGRDILRHSCNRKVQDFRAGSIPFYRACDSGGCGCNSKRPKYAAAQGRVPRHGDKDINGSFCRLCPVAEQHVASACKEFAENNCRPRSAAAQGRDRESNMEIPKWPFRSA